MAKYRPPHVESGFSRGVQGAAETRISEDKKYILIRFRDDGKKVKIRRTKDLAGLFPGKWFISLNSTNDEIAAFRPLTGNYKGVVEKFAAKEGSEPAPKTKPVNYTAKDGSTISYTKTYFWVVFKILEPEKYAGIKVSKEFLYNFREAVVDRKSVVGFLSKGERTRELEEFCDLTGVWERGPMEWEDNILPALEKRILRANKPIMFVMKDGWIDTLYEPESPDVESDGDDGWEEEPKTKPETKVSVEPEDDDDIPWEEA